ncbi:MAG: phosphoribosylanthranilate isomerase [Gammaproteobacteria bacterium]|nr:phosphoribosylanthranilate isomerase [Gammaproteobacteria bacterium]
MSNANKTQRVRVKICGITNLEDAVNAAAMGVDAIGLVFYQDSPRNVDTGTAREIIAALPPFVTPVGLFVDPTPDHINSVLDKVSLDLLQFHGNETPEQCRRFSKPYIKAVRVRDNIILSELIESYPDASALLLDAYVEGMVGGTGQKFDWDLIPYQQDKPIILAGGLDPANVAAAIRQVQPYAVDVSGGVESVKGVKDRDKMAAFISEVARIDTNCISRLSGK